MRGRDIARRAFTITNAEGEGRVPDRRREAEKGNRQNGTAGDRIVAGSSPSYHPARFARPPGGAMGIEDQKQLRIDGMSGSAFRRFQAGRPDHERWELVAGTPIMMTPPTITHNRIAGNLERLLNDALMAHDPARVATQRPGVEIASGDYRPEPDVGVIDADFAAGQRFVDRVYLLAEIASATDDVQVPGTQRSWIDVKRDLYLAHAHCDAVLIIEQDRMDVRLDVKTETGWCSQRPGPGGELALPAFGLRCHVEDLYEGTPLRPRRHA
jgi:Uma2 family endonuclease